MAGTDVESPCVEPVVHQAIDRHRADMSAAESKVLMPSSASAGAAFPAARVGFGPVAHPGAQAPDLSQAPLHATSPFRLPLVHQVAHDGVDVDVAALCTAAWACLL